MNGSAIRVPNRTVMVHSLAVVGFIALIGASIWLAVYSARYVPTVTGRIGSAAVFLSSLFAPASEPSLSVVPTTIAPTTIPPDEKNSTPAGPAAATLSKPAPTTAGEKTSGTYQISGPVAPTVLSGLPDLIVTINAIGYFTVCSDTNSFVASSTVPSGKCPAITFTIKNVGTNVSGSWRFSASIPTQTAYIYQSQPQQSLNPGDSIEYTLGFDQAIAGTNKMISITANFDGTVAESNPDNNSASAQLTILGG